jgi:energy-coupling factor transporter transmembrane protein EcfT
MSLTRRRSPLERANPLALFAVGLLAVVASAGVRNVAVGVVCVATVLVLAAALTPGLRTGGWRLLAPCLAAASVVFSSWLLGHHDEARALTAGLRVLVLALPGVLLAPLIDPLRLGDHLAQQLHLPGRPVAAVTASLLRVEQLADTWTQLSRARRARGLTPGWQPVARARHVGAMTFGLLVATLRASARMSVAMDARGFAAARHRSWAEPATWTRLDTLVLAAGVAFAALPFALSAWPGWR